MIRLDAQLHGCTMQSLLASIESAEKAARFADSMIYDGHDPNRWSQAAQASDELAEDGRKQVRRLLQSMLPGVDLDKLGRVM